LTWKSVPGATQYLISYGLKPGEKLKTITIDAPASVPNSVTTVTGLTTNTTYYWTIQAVNSCGDKSKVSVTLAAKTYNRVANFYKYK
jgi:hypothetical protein